MDKRTVFKVTVYYQNKEEYSQYFTTHDEAMDYFKKKYAAFKFGLVGFSVSYPHKIQIN